MMPHLGISLFWITIPVGLIMFGITIWIIWKKQNKGNEELLSEIKSVLIEIDTCERNAAVKKGKQSHSKDIINKIAKDAFEVFSSSMPSVASAVRNESGEGDIDYLISIFSKLANILDIENYGLNSELSGTTPYEDLNADLAKKRAEIQARKRKRVLIQKNIDRISALTYGVNSSIIHKEIIKSAPKSKQPPVKMMMNIEAIGNAARKALPRFLNDLDKEWKWKVNLNESDNL